MKTKSIFLVLLIVVFCMPVQAQINVKKLGSQIKRSAEQQVEQKVKEKADYITDSNDEDGIVKVIDKFIL